MDFLCKVCDRSIFENESKRNKYLATLRKESDKSIYNKYTINNFKLDEFNENLHNYISTHNRKFDFYFISFELVLAFDNIFIKDLNIWYVHNKEINKINQCLLYCIDVFQSKGYKIFIINQMTIKTINDICNITYEYV